MNKYIKLVYEKLWCLLAVFYWVQLYEDYPYSKAFDENGKDIPFDNIEEAFQAYKVAKENHIKDLAVSLLGKIDDNVYKALINYEVNIND